MQNTLTPIAAATVFSPSVEAIAAASNLAPQQISQETLSEKYLKEGETTADDMYRRVARAFASAEPKDKRAIHEAIFLKNLRAGAVGAGRIMSAAGTDIKSTLINCFVQPLCDSISQSDDGAPGIYIALTEAAETMRRGGGVGYDFSPIRPRNAYVNSTASIASGPCSYIDVFDKSCGTVESAGARRGAQMGVLRIDHPDVFEFITAKREPGRWKNFNVSVGVTEAFMQALENDQAWDLVHKAAPSKELQKDGAHKRADDLWVYKTLPAKEVWAKIMQAAYDYAEPGVLFLDNINSSNNLRYCEIIASTNPCAEQPLPPYGCCNLGPILLTKFIRNPFGFGGKPAFDYAAYKAAAAIQVRALDNILDITIWPVPQQQKEAASKRRIGVGFTGLGNALAMLCVRYDSEEGRAIAAKIAEAMRDAAYEASIELAKERGAFPLFNADDYLALGTFASTLPAGIQKSIRKHGIRNSHLLSIAPVGTISLALADNASNGVEPPFSWTYTRKKREPDGSWKEYQVEDYSWRLYRHLGGDVTKLPDYFVTALEMPPIDHIAMLKVLQPYIDSAISKTINVPVDFPFESFQGMYVMAWKAGLKGVATYRPNSVIGSVLSLTPTSTPTATAVSVGGANHRLSLERLPAPVLSSLRWPSRPELPAGNPAWTFMVHHPFGDFALFVGELTAQEGGLPKPFEVWVNGTEQPRGLGALCKTLSMDLRSNDPAWLQLKLDALATVAEEHSFEMPFPPHGESRLFPGVVAATAAVIRWRCDQLKALADTNTELPTPVMDAMFSRGEPQTGLSGTLAWSVDVDNPATGEAITVTLKEVNLQSHDGTIVTRPCSVGFSGNYPRALDGLARLLSLDMRVIDPAWIGMKLRKLLNYAEPLGHFMAFVPGLSNGERRQQVWPSTVSYIARLIIHRYAMLGVLNEEGYPLLDMGVLDIPKAQNAPIEPIIMAGKKCAACGINAVIKKDSCEFCTNCGAQGACG